MGKMTADCVRYFWDRMRGQEWSFRESGKLYVALWVWQGDEGGGGDLGIDVIRASKIW